MAVSLDKKINSYLGQLNEKQKKAVLGVVKTFAEEQEHEFEEYSDEFKKQLDDDYEAHLKGEPAISWEDLKKESKQILYNDAKQ